MIYFAKSQPKAKSLKLKASAIRPSAFGLQLSAEATEGSV